MPFGPLTRVQAMSMTGVRAISGKGTTALHVAAGAGHAASCELLLQNGMVDINHVALDHSTALDRAMDCLGTQCEQMLRSAWLAFGSNCDIVSFVSECSLVFLVYLSLVLFHVSLMQSSICNCFPALQPGAGGVANLEHRPRRGGRGRGGGRGVWGQ